MKKKFSISWKSSKQPRKQRKYRHKAPLHVKNKFLSAHLSKELREKHNKRAVAIKKGDKIKILRGQFKGKTGAVERVDLKKTKVYITGIEITKKDGSKAAHPINPSNLMISDLDIDDKARQKTVKRIKK